MDMTVEANNDAQPIIPEDDLKYFLPNNPRTTNVASGRSGIKAMYAGFIIKLIFHFCGIIHINRFMASV